MQQLRRSARLARRRDSDLDYICSCGGHHIGNDIDGLATYPDITSNQDDDDDDMEGVKHPLYRRNCLADNHINFRHPHEQLPDAVAAHVGQIASITAEMPELAPEIVAKAIYGLDTLGMGCGETAVRDFLNIHLLPQGNTNGFPIGRLLSIADAHVARHLLPNLPTAPASWPVTQPRPDLLYGHPVTPTFTSAQLTTLRGLHRQITNYAMAASNPDLWFPFFAVEFKATAGTGGNLWVAANQCAGALAACLQAVNQLNTRLGDVGCNRHVPNLCYGLTIDNSLAQLYVSWGVKDKGDLVVYIQRVASFLLSSPKHFTHLHRWVKAILEWGQGERLGNILLALDYIREEQQKVVSGAAKHRLGPEREGSPERKRGRWR
ncbi:hypothetical protein B0T21DRAFT_415988 [Apiosordaria backusii]|uniref:DUF7924 domain-containing protein n=1 Tax=Apiosordaria backusii TaxID=314023 RepID=A0AA40DNR4_9PEZI|nr:hypothetical protein B0T21DRAFT_415988 [Apiosordaria backusii]